MQTQASAYAVSISAEPPGQIQAKALFKGVSLVGMYVHGVTYCRRFRKVAEIKLSLHVFQEFVLNYEDQFSIHVLEGLYLIPNPPKG